MNRPPIAGTYCWNHCIIDDVSDHPTLALLGADLNRHFPVLLSCWLADFRAAIRKTAEAPDTDDHDFLYFTLLHDFNGRYPALSACECSA